MRGRANNLFFFDAALSRRLLYPVELSAFQADAWSTRGEFRFEIKFPPRKIARKKNLRSGQDSNLRGHSPSDFESDALTTRPPLPAPFRSRRFRDQCRHPCVLMPGFDDDNLPRLPGIRTSRRRRQEGALVLVFFQNIVESYTRFEITTYCGGKIGGNVPRFRFSSFSTGSLVSTGEKHEF